MAQRSRTAAQAQARIDLERAITICICKDGTVSYHEQGQRPFNGSALPVFSVDTMQQARELQTLLCARQYTQHPQLPGEPWFRLMSGPFRSGRVLEVADLDAVRAHFRANYERLLHWRELGARETPPATQA